MALIMRMLSLALFLCFVSHAVLAKDWAQWRGPNSNAYVAIDTKANNYPAELSLEKNLAWSVDLPGPGASTPIVWKGTIFVTCEAEQQDTVCAYDSAGKQLWQKQLGPGREPKHRAATGANPSPVTDGEQVYVYFKSGLLVALSLEGEEAWRVNLQEKYGEDTLWWDLGTSPILTDRGILIAVMQADESYLVTFDCKTGEEAWKVDRTYEVPRECDQSYSTPVLTKVDNQPTVVIFGSDHLTGHDPMTGEKQFEIGGFNPQSAGMWRAIASPSIVNGMAIVPYGRGDFMRAIDLSSAMKGHDEIDCEVWSKEGVGADIPCATFTEETIYSLHDKGAIHCLDLKTGETIWSDKLPRSRNECFSTPLILGDLLYCFREDGVGHVARIDEGWDLLSTIDLDESTVAQPIPYGDEGVLVRTRERLLLFQGKQP